MLAKRIIIVGWWGILALVVFLFAWNPWKRGPVGERKPFFQKTVYVASLTALPRPGCPSTRYYLIDTDQICRTQLGNPHHYEFLPRKESTS